MKILITESQFYSLIPTHIKRRLNDDDMNVLDKIIRDKYKGKAYWMYNDNFETYLNNFISDSIDTFIFTYKKDWDISDDGWIKRRNNMRRMFEDLVPYLKKKYRNESLRYYKQMKS